jgi:hypothetical protein
LTVGDLGRVRDGFADVAGRNRINGRPGLVVSIDRSSGEDLLAMVAAVKGYVADHRMPEGYSIVTWSDASVDVKERLDMLLSNGTQGLAIVFIILAMFFDLKIGFWVAMGVPVSMLGTGALMFAGDQTLNMLSMFAFLMAVGIDVDDAIVVSDNVERHRKMGKGPVQAAIDGTAEVVPSVVSGVMTTILSRCLRFHLGGEAPAIADPSWNDWLREFERLLTRMVKGPASPNARVSEVFIPLYALCARFEVLLDLFIEEELKVAPPPPPTDDDEGEIEKAHEATIRRGIRARMLISLEEKLRLVGRANPDCGTQVAEAVSLLESARHRMDLNYQALAALEQFMLRTLRLFAVRVRPEPSPGV